MEKFSYLLLLFFFLLEIAVLYFYINQAISTTTFILISIPIIAMVGLFFFNRKKILESYKK